jgi:polyisoprenoid-binding protein YceI
MTTATSIPTGTYSVDPAHSHISFEVKHMGIATVRGAFRAFEGTITATDGGLNLSGTVDVASVETGQEQRDGHLQSPDFFDAAQFPQISYSAGSAEIDGEDVTLNGEITIKGVTKPITLTGEVTTLDEDAQGSARVGFDVDGKIDRTEFGLTFNSTLPGGNVMVSDKVKIVVSVSAVKAA